MAKTQDTKSVKYGCAERLPANRPMPVFWEIGSVVWRE